MTFFVAFTAVGLVAIALLVLAGRESLRLHHEPAVQVRSLAGLLHLIALGYGALNDASVEVGRRRTRNPW